MSDQRARDPRVRRRFGYTALSVLMLVAVACQPAQVTPENKPIKLVGVTNGTLTAGQLSQVSTTCRVYREAAGSFNAMVAAAKRDGVQLGPSSCYRDLAGQQAARDEWCARGQCYMAAVPGTSNHGWGKAVDFLDQTGILGWSSPGYTWMKENAGRFGWNHQAAFRPDGSSPEAWHWEWIGDGGTLFPGQYFGEGTVSPLVPGNPSGGLDGVSTTRTTTPSTVRVNGWAIDPESQASIDVQVTVDGALALTAKADKTRGDVAAAFPAWQTNPHGYDVAVPITHGAHRVCAVGVNASGAGVNTSLGCRDITIDRSPFGSLDEATVSGSSLKVRGWAMDADTTGYVMVHTYLNGRFVGTTPANLSRPDLATTGGPLGTMHGYQTSYTIGVERGSVCGLAINVASGVHFSLGCKSI